MKIGYARVSTNQQDTQLKKDAFAVVSCEWVYEEVFSAKTKDRPELSRILNSSDTVVVWRLDRLGRSLKDLI